MSDNLLNKLKKLYENIEVDSKSTLNVHLLKENDEVVDTEIDPVDDNTEFIIPDLDEPTTSAQPAWKSRIEGKTPIYMFQPDDTEPKDLDQEKAKYKRGHPDKKRIGTQDVFPQQDPNAIIINPKAIIHITDKSVILGIMTPDTPPQGSEVRVANIHGVHNKILGIVIPKKYVHEENGRLRCSSKIKNWAPISPSKTMDKYYSYENGQPIQLGQLINQFQAKSLDRFSNLKYEDFFKNDEGSPVSFWDRWVELYQKTADQATTDVPGQRKVGATTMTKNPETGKPEVKSIKPSTIDRKLSGTPMYGTPEYYEVINKQRIEKGLSPIPKSQWKLKK